ncbi:3-hydroxyacyl-CoA dehydrogenase NAD-binding domain-containing protein [Pseudomonas aeruginosa]
MTTLNLEIDEQGIALITIDVPGRPMNVFTDEFSADLAAAVECILGDPAIKGAIFTSGKTGSFIAGADLKDLVGAFERGIDATQGEVFSAKLSALLRRLESGGKPVAAALNGLALGGGLELALACHYRVLADDPKAVVGLPEVNVGLLPGAGGTQRLPRLIGIAAALPILLQGRPLKPVEALKVGLVHELAAVDQVVERARQWLLGSPEASQPWDRKGFGVPGGAGPLAAHAGQSFSFGTAQIAATSQGNYPAPLAILSAVYEGTQVAMDVGLRIESKYFGKLLSGAVARNLIRTLFVNKNAADKLAARPQGFAKRKVRKLGVLGAGMMGAGIANVAAAAGIEVVLIDASREQAERGKAGIASLLAKDVQKGKSTQEKADGLLARVHATDDYAALDGADLVVEAVFEDRAIKADVTARAEEHMAAEGIFASNTSTLPITSLAGSSRRPEQFIGLHFFSPVEKMPLVEVIVGERTSEATIAGALDFIEQLRKTPILVHDSPGFFTSRVIMNFLHEGMRMLLDGVAPALVENAARQAGFPAGPLAVADEVSMSLMLDILRNQDLDELPERYRLRVGRPVIERMVDVLKRPGRRGGGGFYEYPAQGAKYLWPGLVEQFPSALQQPTVEVLKQRFLTIMALESARCREEGVVPRAADADIGSILGIGYPSWTGGVLSYIDTVGGLTFVRQCQGLAADWGPRFEPSAWLVEFAERGGRFHGFES